MTTMNIVDWNTGIKNDPPLPHAGINKIDKKEFDLLYDKHTSKEDYDKLIEKVTVRVDYIWREICKIQGRDIDWYDFDNGSDASDFDAKFDENDYAEKVDLYGKFERFDDNGSFATSFPTRFIWEDFEDEVKKIFEKEEKGRLEKECQENNLRKEKMKRFLEFRKSVESKLNQEELSIINFNDGEEYDY